MSRFTEILLSISCIVFLVAAGFYIQQHVHIGCLLGNCAVVITK